MAFIKRLGFYLIGLSIGIVFVTIFLKKKAEETGVEFCYFPNCRVLKDLRSKPFAYSEGVSKMMQDNKIDSIGISSFFKDGSIDFGKSQTKTSPCKTYIIENEIDGKNAVLEVRNCVSKILVKSIEFTD